jgi:sugar lactone lactonase YvrE
MGICFDPVKKECYVADTGNGQVVVFNESGMPVYRFYHYVTNAKGKAVLGQPRSIVVDNTGTIFLVDSDAPYLDVMDPRGRSIRHIDVPSDNCGQPERFIGVALAPDQTVRAVTGCVAPRVATIRDGETITGTVTLVLPDMERRCVTGIAVDRDGLIYVADACAPRMVQIYGPDGAFQSAFGGHDTGYENFAFSAGIAVTNNGDLWIADSIRQVVSRFTHEGKLVAMVGGKGSQPGAFEYPSAVATDGESLLFVLERKGHRYQCLQIIEGAGAEEN